MALFRRIRELFAGDRGDFDKPDMARIREMLDYLRDEASAPPPDAAIR